MAESEVDLSTCQFCGGDIAAGASKCRHCGEWLDGKSHRSLAHTLLLWIVVGVVALIAYGMWNSMMGGSDSSGVTENLVECTYAGQQNCEWSR